MKLTFKLDGVPVDCSIGYSLLSAASTKLKEIRHATFRQNVDDVAKSGATEASQHAILDAFQEHVRTQVPSDGDVREWLMTIDGQHFALIHGTRNCTKKLDVETSSIVLDGMDEKEMQSLADAVSDLCYGSEYAKVNREHDAERLRMAKIQLELFKKGVDRAADTGDDAVAKATSEEPQGEDTQTPPA